MTHNTERYAASDLTQFATRLFEAVGLPHERASTVAEILTEADLMGHSTHGLALLSPYLQAAENGTMAREGEPDVVADHGMAVTWDGGYLPGPWLVIEAMKLAFERMESYPVMTIVIQRSHHIGCLAAYPKRATDQGLMMLLASSDPSVATVAPYGGIRPLYTPNPLAAGIPTTGDPVILDISMSNTANGLVARYRNAGEKLPHRWLLDNEGQPTDDPNALYTDPPGTILPIGGMDVGYKGFGLGLLVEAMTSALAGHGRKDGPDQWGASVFLQILNPEAFGGHTPYVDETGWLVNAAHETATRPGDPPVRVPGERGLALRRQQLEQGIALHPTIVPSFGPWAEKFGVPVPQTVAD